MDRVELTDEEYERYLGEGLTPAEPFRPMMYRSPDGDHVEVFFSDEAFTGKRIDGLVTVYVGRDTGKIVGLMVAGAAWPG